MIADGLPHSAAADADTNPVAGWQIELQQAFRSPAALAEALGLSPCPPHADTGFDFRVPRAFAARMRRGDVNDPLLRQVWPSPAELLRGDSDYLSDPVGDLAAMHDGAIIHKYQGRALVPLTGACAVHCRYCFRRHFPYGDHTGRSAWRRALEQLRADTSIAEVILSGGDPLSLPDARLAEMAGDLASLPQLKRLRIHTRQPVVLPSRVDAALCDWLARFPQPVVVVLHVNHPQEMDAALRAACVRLRSTGVQLLNQAVLLSGVNDSAETQIQLAETLFDAGILPYYLHLLDKVAGAAHFAVPEEKAMQIMTNMTNQLPGYLVPRLAREDVGAAAKTLLY